MRDEDFFKILAEKGYSLQRISGSHFIFRIGEGNARRTLPVVSHGHEVRPDVVDAILRLVEMSDEEYRERRSAIPRQQRVDEVRTVPNPDGATETVFRIPSKSNKKSKSHRKKAVRVADSISVTSDPDALARYEEKQKLAEKQRAEHIGELRKRAELLLANGCERIFAGEQQEVAREIAAFIREAACVSFGNVGAVVDPAVRQDDLAGVGRGADIAGVAGTATISAALSSLSLYEMDVFEGDPRLLFDISFVAVVAWIEDNTRMLDELEERVGLIFRGLDIREGDAGDEESGIVDRESHRKFISQLFDELDNIDFECVDFGVLLKTLRELERRHWRHSGDVAELRNFAMQQMCSLHHRAYIRCRQAVGEVECFSLNTSWSERTSHEDGPLVDFVDGPSMGDVMEGKLNLDPLSERSMDKVDGGMFLLMKLFDTLLDEIPSGKESEILGALEVSVIDALSRQVFGYCEWPDRSPMGEKWRPLKLLERLLKSDAFRDGSEGRQRYVNILHRFVQEQEDMASWYVTNPACGASLCKCTFCRVVGNVRGDLHRAAGKVRDISQILESLARTEWSDDAPQGPRLALAQFCRCDYHMLLRPLIVDGVKALKEFFSVKKQAGIVGTLVGEMCVAISSAYSFVLCLDERHGSDSEIFRLRTDTISTFFGHFSSLLLKAGILPSLGDIKCLSDGMWVKLYLGGLRYVYRPDAPETDALRSPIDFNQTPTMRFIVYVLVRAAADSFNFAHSFPDDIDFAFVEGGQKDLLYQGQLVVGATKLDLRAILELHAEDASTVLRVVDVQVQTEPRGRAHGPSSQRRERLQRMQQQRHVELVKQKIASSAQLFDAQRVGIERIQHFLGEFNGYLFAAEELSCQKIAALLTQLYDILLSLTAADNLRLKLEKSLVGLKAWDFVSDAILLPKFRHWTRIL